MPRVRSKWRVVALLALWTAALAAPAAAQEAAALDGRLRGAGAAEGAVIEIAPAGSDPSEGYRGRFLDAAGRVQAFEADAIPGGARAVLDMGSGTTILQIEARPFGAEVTLIPIGPDGVVDLREAEVLAFLREGLDIPEPPEGFVPPPGAREAVTANGFLASYEFWAPAGVRDGYLALSERYRRLIRLFPAVQLDVIWKLCLAEDAAQAQAIALRGEPVSCPDVTAVLARAQATGRFDTYKAEVAAERESLRTAMRCADNYVMPRETCARASRALAEAATRLETTAGVLARYR